MTHLTNNRKELSAPTATGLGGIRCVRRMVLALLLCLAATAVRAAWQEGDWTYTKNNDGQCWIIDYTGSNKASKEVLLIPESFENGAVRVVGFTGGFTLEAFTALKTLGLSVSTDITAIPDNFARGLARLENVKVNVEGSSSANYQLPTGITTIGAHAFAGTAIQELSMPGVTTVGEGAFQGCNSLKKVTLAKTTTIGQGAFQGCNSLQDVTFGQAATIGDDAFADCHIATERFITYPGPTANWSYRAFRRSPNIIVRCTDAQGRETACGWAGDTGTESCVYWTRDAEGSVTIACDDVEAYSQHPDKQVKLNNNWNANNIDGTEYTMKHLTMRNVYTTGVWIAIETIETVTLQQGVTAIDESAFQEITTLTTVSMTADVKTIDNEAFWGCTGLTDLWYDGSKTQWNDVRKGDTWKPKDDQGNDLTFAVHYRCTLTFNLQGHGSTAPEKQRVWNGEKFTAPATSPAAEGYAFGGWYSDAACTQAFDFGAVHTDDATAYAKWTAQPQTVSFNMRGKGSAVAAQTVIAGETATEPDQQFATDTDGTLWGIDAWCTDEDCTTDYDFATAVTHPLTLYARWLPAATATIVIEDGSSFSGSNTVSMTDAKGRAADTQGRLIAGTCTLTVTPFSGISFTVEYAMKKRNSEASDPPMTLKGNTPTTLTLNLSQKDVDIKVTFSTKPIVSVSITTDGTAMEGTYTMADGRNNTYTDGSEVPVYDAAAQPDDAIILTITKGNGVGCALTIVNDDVTETKINDATSASFTPHGNVHIELFFYNTATGWLTLTDNGSNTEALADANGKKRMVRLSGRTLFRDGDWNTLCLPFDFDIAKSSLDEKGVTLMELDNGNGNVNGNVNGNGNVTGFVDGTLYLNFKQAGSVIKAGKPYIIKWTKPSRYEEDHSRYDISAPEFDAVTINAAEPTAVTSSDGTMSFVGTYSATTYATANRSILFLGSGNTLYFPQPDDSQPLSIGACRAYFRLNGIKAGDVGSDVRAFVLSFDSSDEQTGIKETDDFSTYHLPYADAWYTLDGVRLATKPAKPGLYIHHGRKVVVK